jgi:hypothetical protein
MFGAPKHNEHLVLVWMGAIVPIGWHANGELPTLVYFFSQSWPIHGYVKLS